MSIPFNRAQLFLGYIHGPRVKAWVQDTSKLIAEHMAYGGRETDEWIWTTVINDFTETFQDHMRKISQEGISSPSKWNEVTLTSTLQTLNT